MDAELQEVPYNVPNDEISFPEHPNYKGDDIQKLSVIQSLPQLLQTEPQQTFSRLIPKILQELPNSSCEFHVMTSKVFKVLMERQVPINLLHAILQGIESRDPIVASAWMETLLAVIGVLTETQIKNDVIPLANAKSVLSQPVTSRIASCRILGRVALHKSLDPSDVRRDILPVVQGLCQDCQPDVRSAMCLQLPYVAQGLGSIFVKGNLLSSLVELASDDHMFVRSASVTAIVQMFPHVTLDVKKTTMLPLVRQLIERSLNTDDVTCTTIAREIGKLLEGLQFTLTVNDCMWFLEQYKTLARKGLASSADEFKVVDASADVTCRQHCATNLPAVATFTFATIPTHSDMLYAIFQDLAADPCYLVRRTVAGCLHEVVKTYGPQNRILKSDFVKLLRDDSEDILQMLVPHMGNTLELFCSYGTLSRQVVNQAATEIGRAMLKCQYELTSGYNWRLLTHFIHQLEHLPNCMPPDFIHQHFTPIILTLAVQGRHKPVRAQAARTLLVFLRYNGKEMQRKWIRDNMISQLCRSESCYTRHIFIRLCINAIDIFSEKYFKEYFYDNLLDLADDPVANIRLCVADLFVVLKRMLVLPEDKLLSTRLNEVLKKYSSEETDRDVIEVFKTKMQEMNSPNMINKDEYAKEQRRRLDEEDRIAAGGKALMFGNNTKKASNNKTSRPSSITKPSAFEYGNTSKSNRSLSVPPKSGASQSSVNNMSFLKQHFYIDAGVNLPSKTSHSKISKLRSSLATELQIEDVVAKEANVTKQSSASWTSNFTDDDKVHLRKLSKNVSLEKKKRYSSVYSSTCLENSQDRKALNRRSLNLTPKETSRIPVCYKNSPRKSKSSSALKEIDDEDRISNKSNTDDENDNSFILKIKANNCSENEHSDSHVIDSLSSPESNISINQGFSKVQSHLPVLKRRSQSEVRK